MTEPIESTATVLAIDDRMLREIRRCLHMSPSVRELTELESAWAALDATNTAAYAAIARRRGLLNKKLQQHKY